MERFLMSALLFLFDTQKWKIGKTGINLSCYRKLQNVQSTYWQGGQSHILSNIFDILYWFSTGLMPNQYSTLISDFHTIKAKKMINLKTGKILLNAFSHLDI